MPVRSATRVLAVIVPALLLVALPSPADQKPKEWNPVIDPANFVGGVDNPYFPLVPGRTLVYSGKTREGTESFSVEVTRRTKRIMGVETMVVIETATRNGETIEISENWFAQDLDGTVWYFGEFTRSFEDGEVSTAGSWEAGVDDARPGIIMETRPQTGDTYFQEFAPDIAQDMATVVSTDRTVETPYAVYTSVLLTKEWTPLEGNSVEHKSYAPGIGLIMEEKGSERIALVEVR